jgi:tRNA (mo5U34)-methyltransferase
MRTSKAISRGLAEEVDRGGWMYEWQLTPAFITPVFSPNLPSVHATRMELIEPACRAALSAAGPEATAIDLACNEGWFAHRLLEWGAARVLGTDIRPDNIRRAELLRDHFGIPAQRLQFECVDVFEMGADREAYDVTLALGLIYHLERPLEALRVARRLTRSVCLIESQLTRQDRPIVRGDGVPGVYHQSRESFAAWVENDPDNPLASAGGVMSLVPNQAALQSMPVWAGFDSVEPLPVRSHHDLQYVLGDRAVVAAHVTPTGSDGSESTI